MTIKKYDHDAKTGNKISCCGQEMDIHGIYGHCMKCANRVILYPEGKEKDILENLIVEFVQTFEPQWKIFANQIHELWKEGTYEDYEAKL